MLLGQVTTLLRSTRKPRDINTPVYHVRDPTCGEDPRRV